ncbi:MAG TPA: hypothetical protein GX694_13640 [Actinomycetales bacterium]|nr:hypothetical protein [Actinomycetales bacterium]
MTTHPTLRPRHRAAAALALALAPALVLAACGSDTSDGNAAKYKTLDVEVSADLPAELTSLTAEPLILAHGKATNSFGTEEDITPMVVVHADAAAPAKIRFNLRFRTEDGKDINWGSFGFPVGVGTQTLLIPIRSTSVTGDENRDAITGVDLSFGEITPHPDIVNVTDVTGTVGPGKEEGEGMVAIATPAIPGPINGDPSVLVTESAALCTNPDGEFVASGKWTHSLNSDKPLELPRTIETRIPLTPAEAVTDDTECLFYTAIKYPSDLF